MASLLKDDIFGGIGSPNALEGFIGDVFLPSTAGEFIFSGDVDVANSVIMGIILCIPL